MFGDPEYRERWERKKRWYKQQGVLPREEGGGEVATLVETRDSEQGGIDARQIRELVQTLFG